MEASELQKMLKEISLELPLSDQNRALLEPAASTLPPSPLRLKLGRLTLGTGTSPKNCVNTSHQNLPSFEAQNPSPPINLVYKPLLLTILGATLE